MIQDKVRQLLISYKDVFSTRNKITNLIENTIKVTDDRPFNQKLQPMSESNRKAFCDLVTKMEADGLIEKR